MKTSRKTYPKAICFAIENGDGGLVTTRRAERIPRMRVKRISMRIWSVVATSTLRMEKPSIRINLSVRDWEALSSGRASEPSSLDLKPRAAEGKNASQAKKKRDGKT